MLRLYQIATDHNLDLETRYAALKLMRELNSKRCRLTDMLLRVYKVSLNHRREQLPQILHMNKDSVTNCLYRLKTKGYETFDRRMV